MKSFKMYLFVMLLCSIHAMNFIEHARMILFIDRASLMLIMNQYKHKKKNQFYMTQNSISYKLNEMNYNFNFSTKI